jgi:hypothetical protein
VPPGAVIIAGKTLEDIITGWQQELEKHSADFVTQARLLDAWDKAVLSNRHALLDVEEELRAVHAGQEALEKQLGMIETHQKVGACVHCLPEMLYAVQQQVPSCAWGSIPNSTCFRSRLPLLVQLMTRVLGQRAQTGPGVLNQEPWWIVKYLSSGGHCRRVAQGNQHSADVVACKHEFCCCMVLAAAVCCSQEVHDSLVSVEAEAERLFTNERSLMDADTLDRDRLYARAQQVMSSCRTRSAGCAWLCVTQEVLACSITRSTHNKCSRAGLNDRVLPDHLSGLLLVSVVWWSCR